MNIRTKLILSVGILAGMIILLVALSVVNLQILTATEPYSPAAMPGLERALLWISVTGAICILASIVLLVWLPRSINKPIQDLPISSWKASNAFSPMVKRGRKIESIAFMFLPPKYNS